MFNYYIYVSNKSLIDKINEIYYKLGVIYQNRLIEINESNKDKVTDKNKDTNKDEVRYSRYANVEKELKTQLKNLLKDLYISRSYSGVRFNYVFPCNHSKTKKHNKPFNSDPKTIEYYNNAIKYIIISEYEIFEKLDFLTWKNLVIFYLLKLSIFVDDLSYRKNAENMTIYYPITTLINKFDFQGLFNEIYEKNNYVIRDLNGFEKILRKHYSYDKMERFTRDEIIEIISKSKSNDIKGIVAEYNAQFYGEENFWEKTITDSLFRYYIKKYDKDGDISSLVKMRYKKKDKNQ